MCYYSKNLNSTEEVRRKMKFSHYNYKCVYYETSDDTPKNIPQIFTASTPSEINTGLEYHSSFISIYTKNAEFENFNFGVDFSPPGSKVENRCEDRLYLNFIIQGRGQINGTPFSAGHFYYTLPLQNHTFETDFNEPFVSVWMAISGTYSQHIINKLNEISQNKFMHLEYPMDVLKIAKIFLYETNLGEMTTSYLKSFIDIFLSYITPINNLECPEFFGTDKISEMIRESKIYVRKNLKSVTVAEMAAKQHYSVKYFSRVFTNTIGMTPLEYITDCKMEWAKNSLAHSNLSTAEIMDAIGYKHRNSFTIAFKKKYGCSPTEFRKQAKADAR